MSTRVLLVEDDPGDAYILKWHLKADPRNRHQFELDLVERLSDGLDRLGNGDYEIVLLDLGLPDSLGLETFSRANREAPDLPIVVLSGLDDEDVALTAVREGAQDYLVKGELTGPLLTRSIRYAIERHHMQRSLRNMSLTDALTGLYNRRGFETLAGQQLREVKRSKKHLDLLFFDLDGLKAINDTHGHQVGDAAIREVAEILDQSFRDSDIVARLGGDEFAVLLVDARDDSVKVPLERVDEHLEAANALPERAYGLSISSGRASWDPAAPRDLDELLEAADRAMYREKHRGAKRC